VISNGAPIINQDLTKARKRNTGIVVFQWVNESERKKGGKRRKKYENIQNQSHEKVVNMNEILIKPIDEEIDDVEEIEEIVMKDSDSPTLSPSLSPSSSPRSSSPSPSSSPPAPSFAILVPPIPLSEVSLQFVAALAVPLTYSAFSVPSKNSIQMLLN